MSFTQQELEKNNEIFSNSLAYTLIWEKKFKKILYKQGKEDKFINEYCGVLKKYVSDFQEKLQKL